MGLQGESHQDEELLSASRPLVRVRFQFDRSMRAPKASASSGASNSILLTLRFLNALALIGRAFSKTRRQTADHEFLKDALKGCFSKPD